MTGFRTLATVKARAVPQTAAAACVFFAFTAPFGIAAHLLSELVGLGWRDDADVAFSARHGYLALIALGSFVSLVVACASVAPERRRARAAELVAALPFGGAGVGFALFSFAAQFGFFALSQLGEGCPLCGGDVVTGVFAAAIAAALGALTITLCKRRLIEFAIALCCLLGFAFAHGVARSARGFEGRRNRPAPRRSPFAFRYRPPPFVSMVHD